MFGVLWGFFKFILIFTFFKSSFSKELRNLGSCLIIIKLSFEVPTLNHQSLHLLLNLIHKNIIS